MIARNPRYPIEQGSLPLRPEADLPVPRTVVRKIRPVCSDGERWVHEILSLAVRLGQEHGPFTPSRLRARADAVGLGHPPSGKSQWWGVAFAQLPDRGFTKRFVGTASTTPSRNAARDLWEYVPVAAQGSDA